MAQEADAADVQPEAAAADELLKPAARLLLQRLSHLAGAYSGAGPFVEHVIAWDALAEAAQDERRPGRGASQLHHQLLAREQVTVSSPWQMHRMKQG